MHPAAPDSPCSRPINEGAPPSPVPELPTLQDPTPVPATVSEHDLGAARPIVAQKRARGRPKGSKNKKTAAALPKPQKISGQDRRPVGRPKKVPPRLGVEARELDVRLTMPSVNSERPSAPIFTTPSSAPGNIAGPSQPRPNASHIPVNPPTSTRTGGVTVDPSSQPEDFVQAPPDPSRRIESDEDGSDCDEDDGSGDGAGDDLDLDTSDETQEPRRRVPEIVMRSFRKHQERIKASTSRVGNKARVSIYNDLQDLWLPRSHPFFALSQPTLNPDDLLTYKFLYWDPQQMPLDSFKCPQTQCLGDLTRHANAEFPRRIIDLPEPFYLIGVRYRCNSCGRTFASWDKEILRRLPYTIQAQFPAELTHRSGMSKELFSIMVSCFQNGMGASQFSDMVNAHYRQRYEQLECQYYSAIADRHFQGVAKGPYPPFPRFEDTPLQAPSAAFCRDLYDKWMELCEKDFDQFQALLSTLGMAIDHSYKIPKHIAKILGEAVFVGLLTMTNLFGEIRICDLVPSKAHSQFSIALSRMAESIQQYGLTPPKVIFTDNMADKAMLEEHFPSLKAGVQPVGAASMFGELEIPQDVQIEICSSAFRINSVILGLVETLTRSGSEDATMVVGLDTEWNVDVESRRNRVDDPRRTAIMQIAYGANIWIFKLTDLIRDKQVPIQLCEFLANPQVIKVGKNVELDLRYLHEDFQYRNDKPFVGGLDIARLARDKCATDSASVGLSHLCEKVLSKILPKDPATRVSPNWSGELTPVQIQYAALDVWASLKVYEALHALQVPSPINFAISHEQLSGVPVFLFNNDRTTIVASGVISPDILALNGEVVRSLQGINITDTRTIVQVDTVYVPGAIMTLHKKQALSEFGPAPFNVVCRKTQLKSFIAEFAPDHSSQPAGPKAQFSPATLDPPTRTTDSQPSTTVHVDEEPHSTDIPPPDYTNLSVDFSEENSEPTPMTNTQQQPSGEVDPISEAEYAQIAESVNSPHNKALLTHLP